MSTEKIRLIINHSGGIPFSLCFLSASLCMLVVFTPSAPFALSVAEGAALLLAIGWWLRLGERRWAWARVIRSVHDN